jgi:putative transferase (TIGR04331 family)
LFLATTALSEFWDKDQEIIFLGSWCLRYDTRTEWEGLKCQVMPSPWNDRKRFYEAAQYVDEYGERVLNHLTDYLNSVHGVSHSQRYWRILLGPWLLHCLHAAYDRYIHLLEAFSRHPELQSIVLDTRSFRAPMDTIQLVGYVSHDPYNLQLFSQLLHGLGYSFPMQMLQAEWLGRGQGIPIASWRCAQGAAPPSAPHHEIGNGGTKRRWAGMVKQGAALGLGLAEETVRRMQEKRWRVAFCDMGFPRFRSWALAWGTNLRAIPLRTRKEWSFAVGGPVFDHRRTGLGSLPSSGEFERIFIQSLPQNFPSLYLEAYQHARAEALLGNPQTLPVIMSATGWYFNEPFKFLAAEAAEKGSRLVTVQHGGGYGIFRFSGAELHEYRVSDTFKVWGWADEEPGKCQNLPHPKLTPGLQAAASHNLEQIIFVATDHPRYLYRFHSTPVGSQWEDYLAWQFRFLEAIPEPFRSKIMFHPYPHDYGRAIRQRISERFADIRWDDGQSFYRRLKECRLVVVDNCATTFLEALVANIPTVLFWDPCRWEVRAEAEPYFESLRKVGILWDSPEAASAKVTEAYDEPWAWWGSEAVQEVRQRFVDRYALAKKDWVNCWVKALQEEIAFVKGGGEGAGEKTT